MRTYEFEKEFDQIFLNSPKLFQASEADWDGFEVTEKDVFVHPRDVWQDHFAQSRNEPRLKGMVRTWSFDKLSPGLNTAETRKLVSIRETNAFAYLQDLNSELISRNRILRQVNHAESEVLTNHFEVRNLHPGSSTLDRFLVRHGEQLSVDDRVVIATSLLTTVSQLHHARVAHRDLGPRSIWLRSHSDHALTGFMSCQLPDQGSVVDWLDELRGYSSSLPTAIFSDAKTGFDRDIRSCAALVSLILSGEIPQDNVASNLIDALPPELCNLEAWIKRGLMSADQGGFNDMMEALAEFSELVEHGDTGSIDPSLLDRFETSTIPFVQWSPTGTVSQSITKAQYSTHQNGRDLQVKVWTSVRRNQSAAVDCALLRMLTSTEDLIRSPIHGLPMFIASGISSTGPFVVYERSAGVPLTELQQLPEGIGLSLALALLKAVEELHGRGCEHGDISPANCIVNQDTNSICLIDPFDVSPIGDASVRTPAMCPPNWQTLSQYAIDRYAAIKVATLLLRAENSQFSDTALSDLEAELDRPVIETLEMANAILKQSLHRMRAPQKLHLLLQTNEQTFGFGNEDTLYIRRAAGRFILSSGKSQLVLLEDGSKLTKHWFKSIDFATLANESSLSYNDLPIAFEVQPGPTSGFDALHGYLCGLKQFATPVQPVLRAEAPIKANGPWLDIASHWRHLIDLEEDARSEIQIIQVLSTREATTYCKYQNLGKSFDFDEDDHVEVHRNGWRIGSVDISESDFPNAIAINSPRNEVRQGERLRLVGRRDQASIDRRSRAVNRILEGKSSIPELLNYFDGNAEVVPNNYEVAVTDTDLRDTYQLNLGQREAFKKVLTSGPVGLLQGPPGTGKTRFIAALIHWLLTKGGAQRILVASQAHEAVNNAVEALLLLHKKQGTKPSLIRIGSKGITSRIRPYYTAELRERYRVRFEAAARSRFMQLTSALGIDKKYSSIIFDLDKDVGAFARRCTSARTGMDSEQDVLAIDKERNRVQLGRLAVAFSEAYRSAAGISPPGKNPLAEYNNLVAQREDLFSHVPPADRLAARRALALTNDWLNSLASPGRNFEEFLAKTRNVVAATCVGVGETRIRIDSHVFDWVIVDEAARCTPGELAVPIQVGRRVLLVGDHLQLPPMLSRDVVERLREENPDRKESDHLVSDFERSFTSTFGKAVGSTLTEQYRMDPQICSLVSECFYEPHRIRLSTSPDRPESTFPQSKSDQWLNTPIAWIDTITSPLRREWRWEDESTTRNTAEVDAVLRVLERLSEDASIVEYLTSLEDETPIGVICMYSGQRDEIEASFSRRAVSLSFRRMVRIDTVDSYQGKENAIVVLSLVRDNPYGDAGHVGRPNRCNVAISRARDRLIVVGSSQMWAGR